MDSRVKGVRGGCIGEESEERERFMVDVDTYRPDSENIGAEMKFAALYLR